MDDSDLSELISAVVQRGNALGVSTGPDEVRHRFSGSRRRADLHAPSSVVFRRRVGAVLVAALILAVFFVPVPHVSLFRHLVAPAGRNPSNSSVPGTHPKTAPASGQSVEEAWPVGPETIWAWTASLLAGDAQGLELSTDGGQSWSDVTPSGLSKAVDDDVITDLFALDAKRAWVTYGGAGSAAPQTIASTSDGGQTWSVLGRTPSSSGPSSYGCELQFVNASDGWCTVIGGAAGSEGVDLYRTRDGGRSWRSISLTGPTKSSPGALPFACDKDIQFVSPTLGWAVFACNAGLPPLYETTDGGATWVRHDVPAPPVFSRANGSGFAGSPALAGDSGAVGFTCQIASASRSYVYTSSNRGRSWRVVVPPGAPAGWLVDTLSPTRWRLVNGDRILATDDGGRSWRTITSNVAFRLSYSFGSPTAPVVDFVSGQVGWISSWSSQDGYSLWRTTDGASTWKRVKVPGT